MCFKSSAAYVGLVLTALIFSITTVVAQEVDMSSFDSLDGAQEVVEARQIPPFAKVEFSPSEVVFSENSINFDTLDPLLSSNSFPGGRGANKLVIYTPNFGIHTGTNEFGTEAVVQGNTVTYLSGADSTIPSDGVVISGHGRAKNWITDNINVGSKVYIDIMNKTLYVYTTSDSYIFEAQQKINEALSMIGYYKNTLANYSSVIPQNHIQIAQNYLTLASNEKGNAQMVKQYTQEAINEANMAIKTALPFVERELKGVWIRPTETNPSQIISTLDKISETGFNSIFLETYYHGKTIFPSKTMNKYGFTVQNQTFTGFDPLEVWISEAHKRGIKVNIWFQSFYVGNESPMSNPSSILAQRPDWGNKTKKFYTSVGPTQSISEHNGYFLDPANLEVHSFLLELLSEIITTYKPDGINLDYIRYPNSAPGSDMNAWGFSEYARNEFKLIYGVDPVELTVSDALWYDWNQYRRDKVSNFVKSVSELCKDYNVYLSAVIFPDISSALSYKQQDWRSWSYREYVDGFTPLFLTYDSKMLSSMMDDVMRVKTNKTKLYAGLFVTFMGGKSEDLIRQIYETRKMCADGVILFDYAHTTPVYTSTLTAGAFKQIKPQSTIASSKTKKSVSQKKVQQSQKLSQQTQKQQSDNKKSVTVKKNKKGFWIFSKD